MDNEHIRPFPNIRNTCSMLTKLRNHVLRRTANFLRSRGYYVARPHFYNPVPDKNYLRKYDGF